MTDEQKNTMQKLEKAWPKMNDFDKGFILGMAEASMKKEEQKEKQDEAVVV